MRKPAKQRAKEAKAMLVEVAKEAASNAFDKGCTLSSEIGAPQTVHDFCRWLRAAIRKELDVREAQWQEANLKRVRP